MKRLTIGLHVSEKESDCAAVVIEERSINVYIYVCMFAGLYICTLATINGEKVCGTLVYNVAKETLYICRHSLQISILTHIYSAT